MQNLLEELKNLLEQDERFVVDGRLLKNKVIESALKLDTDLIRLLLKNDAIKKHFFQDVGANGHSPLLIFEKIKFQYFSKEELLIISGEDQKPHGQTRDIMRLFMERVS